MILSVKTLSGSEYWVDTVTHSWSRLATGTTSGKLRTETGTYKKIFPIQVGHPLTMLMDPIVEGSVLRMISTSEVVSLAEVLLTDGELGYAVCDVGYIPEELGEDSRGD